MANNPGGALLLRGPAAAVRRLATSAAAAAAEDKAPVKPLYRRLSALGNAPEGSVARTMNQRLREGRRVRGIDVIRFVTKLRKYGRFKHALELMEWMDARGMNMHYGDYALRLRLASKVEGIASAERYFSRLSRPAKILGTYEALLSCFAWRKWKAKQLHSMKR